jgi:hypothetical protein
MLIFLLYVIIKDGLIMKKINVIYFILITLSLFLIGCSNNSSKDVKNSIKRLNVIESSDIEITGTDENDTTSRYDVPNSDFEITDNSDNPLSWDELKNAKVIEVHFSGGILETFPFKFGKITKVVIIS